MCVFIHVSMYCNGTYSSLDVPHVLMLFIERCAKSEYMQCYLTACNQTDDESCGSMWFVHVYGLCNGIIDFIWFLC